PEFVSREGAMKAIMIGVLAAGLSVAGAALADEAGTATLSGRVTDVVGNVLPSASVTLTPRGVTTAADREGSFALYGLPAGEYPVEFSSVGFTNDTRTVTLAPGARLAIEAKLSPHLSEDVTVTASRPRGEVEALTQQKNAVDIVDVLPAEIITSLP